MNRRIASERRSEFGAAEGVDHGLGWSQRRDLLALLRRSVRSFQQRCGASRRDLGTNFLGSGSHQPGAACEAEMIEAAASQKFGNGIGQVRGDGDIAPGGFGKGPFGRCCLYHTALGPQPQTPAGQAMIDIGDDGAIGTHDESDQRLPGQRIARDDTPPVRSLGLVVVLSRHRLGLHVRDTPFARQPN